MFIGKRQEGKIIKLCSKECEVALLSTALERDATSKNCGTLGMESNCH